MHNLLRLLFLGLFALPVAASEQLIRDAVADLSKKTKQSLVINQIIPSPIAGLSQVSIDTKIIYVTNDGKYAILGNLLDLNQEIKDWNLTEKAANKLRSDLMQDVKSQQPIVYKSVGEKIGEVVVFTDIDCSYSRKMHKQISKYNNLGIEVMFLAYPSSRTNDATTYARTQAIWCSADPLESLDLVAAKGKNIENISCENPIKEHMRLGQRLGITGTPAILLKNGAILSGYVPPEQLAKVIKES